MVNVLWGFRWSCTPLLGSIIADYTPKAWHGADLSPGHLSRLVARCRQATRGRWKALSSVAVVGWSGSAAVGGWLIETWRASKGVKVWDGLHSHVNSKHSGKTKSRTRFRMIQAD